MRASIFPVVAALALGFAACSGDGDGGNAEGDGSTAGHGGAAGSRVPSGIGAHIVAFFFDHPYGTNPSPYAQGLPSSFPSYCRL